MIFDEIDRPNWNAYFMALATLVASRSTDKSTKHGAVCVDDDNNILTVGFNGAPRGFNDRNITQERPQKYLIYSHAESNCIANAARNGIRLYGSNLFVTGLPCCACMREIINAGIKKVMYGNVTSKCVDEESVKMIERMVTESKIALVKCNSWDNLSQLFDRVKKYISRYSDSLVAV